MLKTQINQYLQRDIFDTVKSIGNTDEAIAATGGLSALAAPVLSVLKDIGSYVEEHTSKMDNPTNIFKSWKRDDETGRQSQEGKECITWTNNDGDQPENEANAVLMFIQWKGNLNFMRGYVTSAKLRKKLRKTDLDDSKIEVICEQLDRINGVNKPRTNNYDNSTDEISQPQTSTATNDTTNKNLKKIPFIKRKETLTGFGVLGALGIIIFAINK